MAYTAEQLSDMQCIRDAASIEGSAAASMSFHSSGPPVF